MSMRNVRPISPVVSWLGGKRKLASKIIPYIDAISHQTYVEPFMGMGGMFFSRTSRPAVEVINDFSREVVTFFRILQVHYPQFMDTLKFQITSRSEFLRLAECDPTQLTDLQRAARFLFLQSCSFGGKATHSSFGVSKDSFHGFSLNRLQPLLDAAYDRLNAVTIECLNYSDVISRYDAPGTLFYVDPPYVNCEKDYGKGFFERADFEKLATQLKAIEGKFIFSINDDPLIREIFDGCRFEEIPVTYTVSKSGATKTSELIITGPAHQIDGWDPKGIQESLL